jgi:hypothetical protein
MVTGVVIPHELEVSAFEHQFSSLVTYQAAVGGYLEAVTIKAPALSLLFNEEGKVHHLRVNVRATCLWWLYMPSARGTDYLVGDVVVVGADSEHDASDVPAELVTLFTTEQRHKLEALTAVAPNTWIAAHEHYDDFYEASLAALSLLQAEPLVLDVRVRPVD